MSYDIPDEIKYREKIVFGLDFRQLTYAAAFGVLALVSYSLPLSGQAKLALPALFCIAGAAFIFLDLEERAIDGLHFIRGVRKAGSVDLAAQRLVGVRKVEKNAVFLDNGGLRAILKVEPLNFTLLEETQRKAVILAYREFLNHLTTPIQIIVKTSKPNLEDYFAKAQERLKDNNPEMRSLFEDFMIFEQDFLEKNNVRERNFYLVVTHDTRGLLAKATTNGDKQLKELEERTKIIQDKLLACGLKSRRLENESLVDFLSSYSSQEADASEEPTDEKTEKKENQAKNAEPTAGSIQTSPGTPKTSSQARKAA